MFFTRLRLVEQSQPPPAPEYFVVSGSFGSLLVSRAEAHALRMQLQRWIVPRWVLVRDLSGSEIWLPSRHICLIGESTAPQRAYDRQMRRMLDEESSGGSEEWS